MPLSGIKMVDDNASYRSKNVRPNSFTSCNAGPGGKGRRQAQQDEPGQQDGHRLGPRQGKAFGEPGHRDFQQGKDGSGGGDGRQDEKERCKKGPARHGSEDGGYGQEEQGRPFRGLEAEAEHSGEDGDAGQQGDQQVADHDAGGHERDIGRLP